MATCDVARCNKAAVVAVWFINSLVPHGYCRFHGYDRQGRLRWSVRFVVKTEKLRA